MGAIQRRGQSGSSGSDSGQQEEVVLEGRIIGELMELGGCRNESGERQ